MAKLWERLRGSPALKGGFLFLVVAVFAAAGALLPTPHESPLADAERLAFDAQMRILRTVHPRPLDADVVLIGIDEETEARFQEPVALWHRHFAQVLHALAKAKPRAVGVDIVLPERTFDGIVPGLDLAMMRALLDLKRSTRLVYVQTVDGRGRIVNVQPNYRSIVTEENLGIDQQVRDPDGVSRRFGELRSIDGDPVPTLVSQLLRSMGMAAPAGFIDYSLGEPLAYVPIHEVKDWDEARLRREFAGRIVLIGSLLGGTDRWRLPVKLLARDPGRVAANEQEEAARLSYNQPGVLVHLQALRSHLGPGILRPVPESIRWLLCAAAALVVFVRARPAAIVFSALAAPVLALGASLAAIVSMQVAFPIATVLACFWTALVARGIFDAVEAAVERLRLQASFNGQVSPAVMKEMMDGSLSPGVSGQLADVCVLFSDVRDFTTLSENMPPAVVTTVLQRYFDRMVHAVHRYEGTVDKFIGDGMMVLFGAPRKSVDPCGDAVQCALAMMSELDALNADFGREGLPQLTIGIGINYGTVTVGNIGSSERHNYSAIGDAVNVAARVEGLTKDLGRKIIITEAVVSRIEERFHFDPLGSHKVKGHSPVNVWGIRTARTAPAAAVEAEAVQ
ncbi:MAG TPA: adenylate/guanylate cyclase domain-containing protein [Usitatibacter sp.]|nr:adenylate/guanylate cyclase domain-containing protein [Usitatibacter sp.]